MNQPRHSEPLPLGTPDQPYSKGLMARALVAVGVPLGRAYELAKRIDQIGRASCRERVLPTV